MAAKAAPTIKTTSQLHREHEARCLQLYEGNRLVPGIKLAAILKEINDDDIALLAKGQPAEIKGRCELRAGAYVGTGTCLAQKYHKYGLTVDNTCESCRSQEIVDQLNYVLMHKYKGQFRAEWKKKKGAN